MTDGSHRSPRGRIVSASELAQYGYCRKAWWIEKVERIAPTNTDDLARGTRAHRTHGQIVWWSRTLPIVAAGLILFALAIAWATW